MRDKRKRHAEVVAAYERRRDEERAREAERVHERQRLQDIIARGDAAMRRMMRGAR